MPPPAHEPDRRPGLADAAAIALVGAAIAALEGYFALDARPPADLGHYYESVPELFLALTGAGSREALGAALGEPGGVWNLALAGAMALVGRSARVVEHLETGWLLLLLTSIWALGRTLGGRRAGLGAVALAVAMPVFQVGARTHWLHFVEVAAVTGGTAAWAADRGLERRGTRVALALLAWFCLSLRATGILYVGPLLALVALRSRRLALPLAGAALGMVVVVPGLGDYIGGKVAIRGTYAQTVRPLLPSLAEQTFMAPGLLGLAGLLVALSVRRDLLRHPAALLLLAWAAGSLALGGVFHVGIDNFPLLFVALAVLGGQGLALASCGPRAWAPIPGVVAVSGAAAVLAAPFLPLPVAERLVAFTGPAVLSYEPWHYLRPQARALGPDDLRPLVEAACAAKDDRCTILATTGIFDLNREDDGAFALFTGGVDGVEFVNAGQWWTPDDLVAGDTLEGLVVMDCPAVGAALDSFTERAWAVGLLARGVPTTEIGRLGSPAPCPQWWFRLEGANRQSAVLAFARAYPWKAHVLPEKMPPARPGR